MQLKLWWAKREVTVHQAHGGKVRDRAEQGSERRIADQLVSSADTHATFPCEGKQTLDFPMSLGQRLLDVHVSSGPKGTAGRLEVRSGGAAHVHDVRLSPLQPRV